MKSACVLPAVLLVLLAACNSPLDIETPRTRSTDRTRDTTQPGSHVSLAVALDMSGSMSGVGADIAQRSTYSLIDSLDGSGDEAAILSFSTTVQIIKPMTSSKASLDSAVATLFPAGTTSLWDAVYAGTSEVFQHGVNSHRGVIVLTDGNDNSSTHSIEECVAHAIGNNIPVSFVGLGAQINVTALQHIADTTHGSFHQVSTQQDAQAAFQSILRSLR